MGDQGGLGVFQGGLGPSGTLGEPGGPGGALQRKAGRKQSSVLKKNSFFNILQVEICFCCLGGALVSLLDSFGSPLGVLLVSFGHPWASLGPSRSLGLGRARGYGCSQQSAESGKSTTSATSLSILHTWELRWLHLRLLKNCSMFSGCACFFAFEIVLV